MIELIGLILFLGLSFTGGYLLTAMAHNTLDYRKWGYCLQTCKRRYETSLKNQAVSRISVEGMFTFCPVCKFPLRDHTDDQKQECILEFSKW